MYTGIAERCKPTREGIEMSANGIETRVGAIFTVDATGNTLVFLEEGKEGKGVVSYYG